MIEEIIKKILEEKIKEKSLIYYSDLAKAINKRVNKTLIPEKGNALGTILTKHLHNLCEQSVKNKKPMIGSIVVSKKNNIPSNGYFKHAEKLYNIHLNTIEKKKQFWKNEISKLFGD